jgi:hypothetical protein
MAIFASIFALNQAAMSDNYSPLAIMFLVDGGLWVWKLQVEG